MICEVSLDRCDTTVTHFVLQSVFFFSGTLTNTLSTPVFRRPPTLAFTHLTVLSNQLSMATDHVDWGISKMIPSKNARASSAF